MSIQTNRPIGYLLRRHGIRYRYYRGRRGRHLYSFSVPPSKIEVVERIAEKYAVEYSYGIMQISSSNRKFLRSLGIRMRDLLEDPCLNIKVGAFLLLECYFLTKNWKKALICYNAGISYATGRKPLKAHHVVYLERVIKALLEGG